MNTASGDISLIYLDGEGKVNEEGVQYYNNLIDYMVKQGNDSNTKNRPSKNFAVTLCPSLSRLMLPSKLTRAYSVCQP